MDSEAFAGIKVGFYLICAGVCILGASIGAFVVWLVMR